MGMFTAAVALALAAAHPVKMDWAVDGAIAGSASAAFAVTELWLKPALAPPACRWCDRDASGAEALNPVDAAARGAAVWPLTAQGTADVLSNVEAFGALPLALLGADAYLAFSNGAPAGFWADALIAIEAASLAMVLNQVVKFAAARERPFVHVLQPADKPNTERPSDNNVSFYSGHTTLAFSLFAAALSVAELRGYDGQWLLWAVGAPLAILAPYLRMAADRHYLTDVVTGAVLGGTIGFLVPRLLHPRAAPGAAPTPAFALAISPWGVTATCTFK